MNTKSSALSSVYQVTEGLTDRNEGGIDNILTKIDHNLNTFTTDQFEELRDKVKSMGYYKAQIIA